MVSLASASKPAVAVGAFFAMAWEAILLIPRRPFAVREFLLQSWFVARVSLLPTLMLAMPYTVLVVFTFKSCCSSSAPPTSAARPPLLPP